MCPDLGAEFPYETFRSCSQKSCHKMTTLARVGGPFTNPIPFCLREFPPGASLIGRITLYRSGGSEGLPQFVLGLVRAANLRSRGS